MYEQLYVIHEVEGQELIRAELSDDVLELLSEVVGEMDKQRLTRPTLPANIAEVAARMIDDNAEDWHWDWVEGPQDKK